MNMYRRGITFIELVVVISLLSVVLMPVFVASNTTLQTNKAANDKLLLQVSAQTIMETWEQSVRRSEWVTDFSGPTSLNALPIAPDNPYRTDWMTIQSLSVEQGTFAWQTDTLTYNGDVISDNMTNLNIAFLLSDAQNQPFDFIQDSQQIRGVAVRFTLETEQASFFLEQAFLLNQLMFPTPGPTDPPAEDIYLGDDESYLALQTLPLDITLSLTNISNQLARQNQLLLFPEPSLVFQNGYLIAIEGPVIALRYLSNSGNPDNSNSLSVIVGKYQVPSKGNDLATWVPEYTSPGYTMDWDPDQLNLTLSINANQFYVLTLARITPDEVIPLLTYTTSQPYEGGDSVAFYLGSDFGNNGPSNIKTGDVRQLAIDPNATGLFLLQINNE